MKGPQLLDRKLKRINFLTLPDPFDSLKLPELQAMLYQQDKEAVFTVEYDVMLSDQYHSGPLMIEIRREAGDILGFGLNKSDPMEGPGGGGGGTVYVESVKAARSGLTNSLCFLFCKKKINSPTSR